MGKRRSDNPLAIVVMGVLSVAIFGGMLVYVTDERPILRLGPALVKELNEPEVRARFMPPREGRGAFIVVEVPASLASVEERLRIGDFALAEYRRLAENRTLVGRCEVVVLGDAATPPVVVDTRLQMTLLEARAERESLESRFERRGLLDAQVKVLGLSSSGASLEVTGRVRGGADPKALADLVQRRLESSRFVGRVELRIDSREGAVERVFGKDVPPEPEPESEPGPGGPRGEDPPRSG